MTETLHVATRKGLLTFTPGAGAWRMSTTDFLGEPVSAVLTDARDGALYAALNLGHFGVKLHRSDDGGKSWRELPAPAYPAAEDGADGPSVSQIWTLSAGGADRPGLRRADPATPERPAALARQRGESSSFAEARAASAAQAGLIWAGTIPGGLFRSTDRGESWSLVESLWRRPEREHWFGGGYDSPGIHSVCVDPRDSRRMVLGVSCGGVWLSDDAGESWRLAGEGLRAAYMPPERANDPAIQDPHRLAQCPAAPEVIWCQHHNGIFRSADGGGHFSEIETASPSAFGFAVAVHPADPDTAWFAPAVKDECRVPVDQRFVVTRTSDGGASFETLSDGLPTAPAFDLVYRHGLAVDQTGERLAMGTTTGNLWIGERGGESWTPISTHLPPVSQVAWAPA